MVSPCILLYYRPFTLQFLNTLQLCFVVVVFREPDTGLASEMVADQETWMFDNTTHVVFTMRVE